MSAATNASVNVVLASAIRKRFLIWDDDHGIGTVPQPFNPFLSQAHPSLSFERERFCDYPNRQYAVVASRPGNDRRRTGSGSSTHPRRDEAHMDTMQLVHNFGNGLLCSQTAHLRLRTGPRPPVRSAPS